METLFRIGTRTPARKKRLWRTGQLIVSVGVAGAIFGLVIPKIASYSKVWSTISQLSWSSLLILIVLMVFNLFTYWPQQVAAMPGLTLGQAAVSNQTTTSISDIIPGGGIISVAFGYVIYRSWGFTRSEIALQGLVTGIWNMYMKLGLPVVALGILAATKRPSPALISVAVIGVAGLVGSILFLALVLWKKTLAQRLGSMLGRAASLGLRLLRKPAVHRWGEAAVRLRKQVIALASKQWELLTGFTLLSHIALYLLFLAAVRFVGIPEAQVSWAQVLAVFAFVRLLSMLPLTPGGIGLVELGFIAALSFHGVNHEKVVAAVLLYRGVTYGLQIPLGGFTYIIWRRKKNWLKPPFDHHMPERPELTAATS